MTSNNFISTNKLLVLGPGYYEFFYSHVICLGTKTDNEDAKDEILFYSHVICLGTKTSKRNTASSSRFYSHVICLGTKTGGCRLAS